MRPFAASVAATLCLAGIAVAQPEKPIMLSQVLEAPLLGAATRPAVGQQQPEIASVNDLLVGDDGRTELIVVAGKSESGRIVPWGDLVYDAIRNDFTLRAESEGLGRFPAWQEPVSETQGTASKLLASKLLKGQVQTPSGERLGEVKDVQIGTDGAIKQVFFQRGQQTATIPWKGVDVQPERPDMTPSPGAEAVIVIDRKRL
jgi:hypothetical protein